MPDHKFLNLSSCVKKGVRRSRFGGILIRTYVGGIDEGVLENNGGHLASLRTIRLLAQLFDQAADELGLFHKRQLGQKL